MVGASGPLVQNITIKQGAPSGPPTTGKFRDSSVLEEGEVMKLEALQQSLQEREANDAFSGAILLTQNGKELFAGAYGFANRSWQVPNEIDTRFETASLTKLFAATSILQLIDEGKVSLDTAVIPFLGYDTPISDEVTVFHLLTHSSGIADDADEEAGEDYADLWKTQPNYAVTELVDFLPNFIHKTPNFAPGTGVRYNNVGFVCSVLCSKKLQECVFGIMCKTIFLML